VSHGSGMHVRQGEYHITAACARDITVACLLDKVCVTLACMRDEEFKFFR